ncbi:MAG: SDR family oxidoreductase [Gemmatimonadota bacterium]|nr:SDR family oxidoreductase [Gemmatimonadota bacterium]
MRSIAKYLSGKTLFVTGATGFLAKGFVEKILYSAPEVARIYLLIRPRSRSNGQIVSEKERLESEIFQSRAFERLRARWDGAYPSVMSEKVVAVAGDLTEDGLGISAEQRERLVVDVDFVVNFAGTVVFDEPIDSALEQNTLGAARVVAFAKTCRKAALVHVSTAYVSGKRTGRIPEAPFPQDRSVSDLINGSADGFDPQGEIDAIRALVREVEDASVEPGLEAAFHRQLRRQNRGKRVTDYRKAHQVEALRQRWVRKQLVDEGMRRAKRHGWNDTYTFTKAMGEQLVLKSRGDLPTAIVRPAIVESSLEDPEPGWVEDLKVADPLIVHYGKGRLSNFPIDPGIVLDIIPVDILNNAVTAVLPQVHGSEEMKVYHVASGSQNPVRASEMVELVYGYFKTSPMQDRNGRPIDVRPWQFISQRRFRCLVALKYKLPLSLLKAAVDYLPARWVSRYRRRVSGMEAVLERLESLVDTYCGYTHLDCEFETENTRRLFQALNPEDQKVFNFDVTRINWREYIQEIHIPGLKHHVLKEGDGAVSVMTAEAD